ncbi:hypothetical protein, partial [uncultured Bacteroides sp.]|uniref:hypothetical protein n=1 Tax=uncultured Bacteroides sp. TaxID=162156 RepID=UPI0027DB3B60
MLKQPTAAVVVVKKDCRASWRIFLLWVCEKQRTLRTEKAATFLEQDSTTVPKFAYPLILP